MHIVTSARQLEVSPSNSYSYPPRYRNFRPVSMSKNVEQSDNVIKDYPQSILELYVTHEPKISPVSSVVSPCSMSDLWNEHSKWSFHWGPDEAWLKQFQRNFLQAREQGNQSLSSYLSTLQEHVARGRKIVDWAREIDWQLRGDAGARSKETYTSGYELLTVVLSEVKFCEVMLDLYAPVLPSL